MPSIPFGNWRIFAQRRVVVFHVVCGRPFTRSFPTGLKNWNLSRKIICICRSPGTLHTTIVRLSASGRPTHHISFEIFRRWPNPFDSIRHIKCEREKTPFTNLSICLPFRSICSTISSALLVAGDNGSDNVAQTKAKKNNFRFILAVFIFLQRTLR